MVSSLTKFNLEEENTPEYTLLDSAAPVHVFHTKGRFTPLRRAKGQGLRCGTGIIPIGGWGEVSLPLRVGSQTRLLTPKKVAFIPDFPLNLVSLACLEAQGFDWSHRSGEFRNDRSRIIGTTTMHNNNYVIDQAEGIMGSATAFATTAPSETFNTRSKPRRQDLNSVASPDDWHQRMGHIGPLGLYKLGKECLGVRLRGKSVAQCPRCALSKMTQQISRLPPAKKATRPFYRVFVDWLDLEEGWGRH